MQFKVNEALYYDGDRAVGDVIEVRQEHVEVLTLLGKIVPVEAEYATREMRARRTNRASAH